MSGKDAKVIIIGSSNVGKTCLLEQYTSHSFQINEQRHTIGFAYKEATENVNGCCVTLRVWDTAGSERYDAVAPLYYRNAFAAIVCFDITNLDSWKDTARWIGKLKNTNDTCTVYLCATKIDLLAGPENCSRAVTQSEVRQFASSINTTAFETSAKTGENVSKLFHNIAEDYILQGTKNGLPTLQESHMPTTHLTGEAQAKSKCCVLK